VEFAARVTGAGPGAVRPGSYTLFVLKDGGPLLSVPITDGDFTFEFPDAGAGRYRLQVQREGAIEAVSSPIWLERVGYPRPRSATPLRVTLVPAYRACAAPNREHGPPLAFGSCHQPAAESSMLTVGTPDANRRAPVAAASARLGVNAGDLRTSADEADVDVLVTATDVRERAGLADFTGELTARVTLRITDRASALTAGGGSDPATVSDLPLEIPVACAATAADQGATCAASTTVDALIPGAVPEGRRSIWALGQVQVMGPDDLPFLRQGVFVP
jgi:hypothetical protein